MKPKIGAWVTNRLSVMIQTGVCERMSYFPQGGEDELQKRKKYSKHVLKSKGIKPPPIWKSRTGEGYFRKVWAMFFCAKAGQQSYTCQHEALRYNQGGRSRLYLCNIPQHMHVMWLVGWMEGDPHQLRVSWVIRVSNWSDAVYVFHE